MTEIRVKRIRHPAESADGTRVLVDGMWPRGIKKSDAALDYWFKDLAPSKDLRSWFGHDPDKWNEFRRRYHAELDANPEGLQQLRELLETERTITLLFGAREETYNNAVALAEYLQPKQRR